MRKSIEGVTIIILAIGLTAFILYVINYDAGRDLVNSADEGNLKRVQSLLKKGVAVNARDFYGRTALSRAVEKGRLEIVKLLLDNGANPDKDLSLMLVRSIDVARLLLDGGADVNAKTSDGDTALITAAGGGFRSSMPHAVPEGTNVELVELLLGRGADINAKGSSGTPLSTAAASCNTAMVKLLLKRGADVNAREYCGETALFWATFAGCIGTVRLLLEHGADVNTKDHWGITPLMLTRSNPWDLQLIRDEQRLNFRCVTLGGTAWRPEDTPPNEELIRLLEAHGAR